MERVWTLSERPPFAQAQAMSQKMTLAQNREPCAGTRHVSKEWRRRVQAKTWTDTPHMQYGRPVEFHDYLTHNPIQFWGNWAPHQFKSYEQ